MLPHMFPESDHVLRRVGLMGHFQGPHEEDVVNSRTRPEVVTHNDWTEMLDGTRDSKPVRRKPRNTDQTIENNFMAESTKESRIHESIPFLSETANLEDGRETSAIEPVDEPLAGVVLLGLAANLCMNFLLQEGAYFNAAFGESFSTMCTMIYSICNIASQILVLWKGSAFSFGSRLAVSGIGLGIILILVPALTLYEIKFQLQLGLVLVGAMGVLVAVFMSAAMGLTGMCSTRIRNYFSIGMSIPGIVAWPLMMGFNYLFEEVFKLSPKANGGKPSPMDTGTTLALLTVAAMCMFVSVAHYLISLGKSSAILNALAGSKQKQVSGHDFLMILGPVLPMALAVGNVFFVTFIVLPDQIGAWQSKHRYPGGEYGYQNLNYYTFQVFDTLGRIAVACGLSFSPFGVIIGSALRIGFLPFFFMATHKVSIFDFDVFKFAMNAAFAATYGILLTLGFDYGTGNVSRDKADVAGYIMSFALTAGIFMGSSFALGIKSIPAALYSWKQYQRECSISPDGLEMVCISASTPTPSI